MTAAGGIALAGVAAVAAGGLAGLAGVRLRAALLVQAAGMALLGGAGAAVLAGDDRAGADFTSAIDPSFGLDPLSGFFLVVLALTAVPALVFAGDYLGEGPRARVVAALTGAFLLALTGVLAARDAGTFLAFWEAMTLLPAVAIVVARRDREVRDAIFRYLAITHLGGAGVWVALLTLAHHGALGDPAALAAQGTAAQTLVAVTALVGFATKAGLAPLHSWLPRAHPVAPAFLSALMSGMMVKVALYGLIRVEFEWLGATPRWLGVTLLALGAVSAVGGVLWALVQRELKRLLAYSTIENVGVVVLGLGAALLFADAGRADWSAIAFAAALLHAANHAVFKVLLFLGAGAFERAVGDLDLDRMGGLLRLMPWAGTAFLVGTLSVAAVPPFSGFASEWLTLQALAHLAFDGPLGVALAAAVALAALAAAAAIALVTFVKVAGLILLGPPRTSRGAGATDAPPAMRAALAALAVLCVAGGLLPGLVVPTLADLAPGGAPATLVAGAGIDLPGSGGLPAPWLALGLAALTGLLVVLRGGRRAAASPSWACGQPVVPELRYTSAGFTKPLRLVLETVLRPAREIAVVRGGGMVQRIRYSGDVPSLTERLLDEPVTRAGLRVARVVRRLQTGNVRTYAAYLLGVVVVLLAMARTGVLG